eukprot:160278-Hanusia_phi.AAC.1
MEEWEVKGEEDEQRKKATEKEMEEREKEEMKEKEEEEEDEDDEIGFLSLNNHDEQTARDGWAKTRQVRIISQHNLLLTLSGSPPSPRTTRSTRGGEEQER